MLLYNPTSKRCRLYKSFVNTGGTEDSGWQYYAAECSQVRLENAVSLSVVNQTVDVACRSGFTYLLSPPLPCPLGTGVLDIGKCAQTLWTDQVFPFVTDLPAPLSTGAEIRVRGSGDGMGNTDIRLPGTGTGNTVFLLSIRWSRLDAIFNTQSSGSWGSELGPSGFIFSPNVVFDALVRITTTKFLIFINGSDFYEAPIRIPVQTATKLQVRCSRLDSVGVMYP
ncbi:galectin-4-like [Haliotis rubra]|uniref:galectin-4-like n=1 Tax=Haliotis rubra TaxID=36100 RepID=UPI001EE4F5B2|nr:galectin-4-like [Haliotis rubra]